ncbi:hypothetical protein SPRG_11238 [Saprolegnia parasitica CBS 223.65]|uniref:Uncharacterized protein n=1 Tax=Saprolegnia parasitica (strain CBS 223.65) TaxID=695850 RepID=A0A067CBA5_SAPPC|nr:hypothetical protein SPRG_11238 [Saprolegnia parasitica CBS 223.65]KDO23806.1 hypothetical protein SPRG_11238 [Saprolegnia parasitica CBS 223.65]|eukprot:XP_012205441.1 hypothetical protein SPRG_11238 [Saprolegnia parasitica CBS 223.65]
MVGVRALVVAAILAAATASLRHESTSHQAVETRALVEIKAPSISNDTMIQAREASLDFEKFLANLRGASAADYYDKLYSAVQIALCEADVMEDVAKNLAPGTDPPPERLCPDIRYTGADDKILPCYRFVLASSEYALKDSNGNCIKVLNPPPSVKKQYNDSMCEVKENCYWRAIDPTATTDRAPVYAEKQAVQPPSGSMTVKDAWKTLLTWRDSFGACAIPSAILFVLSFLTIFFFITCRCCCNRCGGRKGKPGGYSCSEKTIPIVFYLMFSIAILVLAGLAYVYFTVITTSVSNVFTIALGFITQIVDWIARLVAPLLHIADTVESSASNIDAQLAGSAFIGDGLNGIVLRLGEFANNTANVTLPRGCTVGTDRFCTPCDACTTISQQVGAARDQMNSVAGTGVSALATARTDIMRLLVSASGTISDFVASVTTTNTQLQLEIKNQNKLILDVQSSWESISEYTDLGFLALFALAIVTIVVGLFGVFFGLTPCRGLVPIMHLAYSVGFIAIIVTFLVSIVFIAVSLVLVDVCKLQTIVAADWTTVFGDQAAGMNACFHANESLIDAFNLTSSFAFATDIEFPTLDLTTMLDFSTFDAFATSINNVSTSTFNLDPTFATFFLDALNSNSSINAAGCVATGGAYTLTNIFTPWAANSDPQQPNQTPENYMNSKYSPTTVGALCPAPPPGTCYTSSNTPCLYQGYIVQLWQNVTTLQTISLQSTQFIADMRTNMTNLQTYIGTFKSNVSTLSNTMNNISTTLQSTLIKDVNTIKGEAYCTFIGATYFELTEQLCGYMTPSFLMIALFLFLIGVFLVPINVTLILMVKRLRYRHGHSPVLAENNLK